MKKSSLENIPIQIVDPLQAGNSITKPQSLKAPSWNFKWFLACSLILILAIAIAVFFALKSYSPGVKAINPVIKSTQLIKPGANVIVRAVPTPTHKASHHKKKKRKITGTN